MANQKTRKAVYRPEGTTRRLLESSARRDAAGEATAWKNVSNLAQNGLTFWNGFIGLQSGVNPLDSTGLAQLTCIVRAVSWVESQHGTGAGASASVDPMQCANKADAWWKELTDCSQPQDRFVGGVGKPNYNACELPPKADADATFPSGANVSTLNDPTAGHEDANFTQIMSYCWAIPLLIQKINTTAGDPTYQCQKLDRPRLVAGAVAYNGGGDPNYETKVNAALDMIGCLQAAVPSIGTRATDPQTIINDCEKEYVANNDDCNKFVKAVSADVNVTLFQPGDNADAIVQRMIDSADWSSLADGVDAKNKADAGQYVIAGLKGADHDPPRVHGHVAVVVSGPLASGKYPKAYWGSLGGTPGKDQTINYAWNATDRDNVKYFATALTVASERVDLQSPQIAQQTAVSIIQQIVRQLETEAAPGKESRFFRNGIELIEISVQVGTAKIDLKVAGPKAEDV
ncbi:hypothetical protein [Granulicella sp. L60]|uniref:hypothetical protein n=1 Tax=Granulicella sp. L60 TaxID=1641866 RepID=UPI001C20700E|nr:hypothetical protein [Granulicella sp. L60]